MTTTAGTTTRRGTAAAAAAAAAANSTEHDDGNHILRSSQKELSGVSAMVVTPMEHHPSPPSLPNAASASASTLLQPANVMTTTPQESSSIATITATTFESPPTTITTHTNKNAADAVVTAVTRAVDETLPPSTQRNDNEETNDAMVPKSSTGLALPATSNRSTIVSSKRGNGRNRFVSVTASNAACASNTASDGSTRVAVVDETCPANTENTNITAENTNIEEESETQSRVEDGLLLFHLQQPNHQHNPQPSQPSAPATPLMKCSTPTNFLEKGPSTKRNDDDDDDDDDDLIRMTVGDGGHADDNHDSTASEHANANANDTASSLLLSNTITSTPGNNRGNNNNCGSHHSNMFDTSNVLAWLQSPTTNGLFSPGFGGFSNGLSLSSYFNTPVANQSAPNSTNLNQNQNEHDMVPPQTPSLRNIMSIPLDVMSSASGAGITRRGGGDGQTAVLLKQRHSLPTVTNATTATAITTTVPNTPNNVITSTTTSFFFSDVANLNSQQQRQQNQLSPPSCGEDEPFTYTPSGGRGRDDDPDDEDDNGRTSRYRYNHVSTISEDRGSSSHNSTGAIGESPTVVHARPRHGANNPSQNNNIICISPLAILNHQQNKKKNYYNYNHDDHIPTPTMDFKEIFASPNEQQRLVQHRRYTYPTNKARASTTGTMVEDNNDENKKSSLHHNDDDEEDEDLNVLLQFTVHHHGTPCRTSAMLDVFRSPPTTTRLRTTGSHRNRTIDTTSSRHNNNDDDMNELPQPQEHDHGDDDGGNRLPALHLPLIRNGSKNRLMNPLPVLHQRLTQKHTNKSTNITNQNDFVPPESGGGKNKEGNTNSSMTYHHPLLYPSTSSSTTDHVHPHHLHPGSHYYSIPPPPGTGSSSGSTTGSMRITVGGSGNSKDPKPPYPDYYHHMHAAAAAQHHVMHPGYPPPPHHHHHLYGPYVGYPIYNPLPGATPGTASSTTYPPPPYGTTSKSTKSASYKRPLSNNNSTKDSGKGSKTHKASSHADNENEKSTTGSNKRPALLSTPSSAALGNVNDIGQEPNKRHKKSANGPSIGGSTNTTTAGSSNSKKKKSSSTSSVGTTPVDRQKTLDTIQNLNAAAGGKNDKAAALAAAILRGVTMRPSGKWQAQLYYAGKSRYIGVFDTREKAALAYEIAREKLKSGSAGVGVGGSTGGAGIGNRPAAASSTLGAESSTLSVPTPTTAQSVVGSAADNKGSSNSAVKSSSSVSCTESLVNLARKAAFDGVNESFSEKP